jgi:asparagine synthase (glutamine-hydrolysing)
VPTPLRKLSRRARSRAHYEALRFTNRDVFDVIERVRAEHLTYLIPEALVDLAERVGEVERSGSSGVLVEAGCAFGGSAIVMAAAKSRERPLLVYDVFGPFPEPSERDEAYAHERWAAIESGEATWPGGRTFYAYVDDLLGEVRASFDRFGVPTEENHVELVKGLYEETLHVDRPVALAHIDCDWHESVRVCLERIVPRLEPGGVLVFDDYDSWEGCQQAVDEYFKGRPGFRYEWRTRLHVVREA